MCVCDDLVIAKNEFFFSLSYLYKVAIKTSLIQLLLVLLPFIQHEKLREPTLDKLQARR